MIGLKRALIVAWVVSTSCADGQPRTGTTSLGIYYETSGSGPAVVLAHGFSLDRRMWQAEEVLLRNSFHVIRYDLRGHGLSEAISEPFSAEADMLSVFEAVDLKRATIVGLSAGAQIAIDFTLAYPDRVEALVLASPGLGGYKPTGSFDWMAPVVERLRSSDYEGAMMAWTHTPLMAMANDVTADSVMRANVLENWRIWSYDPAMQIMPSPAAITRLSEVVAPALVVVGSNDFADTKLVADTLVACLADARLATISDAGHLVNLENPARFDELLTSFLHREAADPGRSRAGC